MPPTLTRLSTRPLRLPYRQDFRVRGVKRNLCIALVHDLSSRPNSAGGRPAGRPRQSRLRSDTSPLTHVGHVLPVFAFDRKIDA